MIQTVKNTGRQSGLTNNFQIITNTGNPQDPISTGTGSADKIFIQINAAENLSKYDVVTTDGYKADSTNDLHKNKILGIATVDILSGQSGTIQTYGDIDNALWGWTSMETIFLNGTNISSLAPTIGFIIPLGKIRNATKIFINIQMSIKL